MRRYLVTGNGCALAVAQPRRRQDLLDHAGLCLSVFIDVGSADASLPFYGGILIPQRGIVTEHLPHR